MEFKGTKGRWRLVLKAKAVISDCGSGDIVCEAPEGWEESMANWEANAKLIAAAPDLLEACKIGLEAIKELHEHQDGWAEDDLKVRAAINKALS